MRAAEEMRRMENERREADEPAKKPADAQWPVEEQPSAETRAKESQLAIDKGALADDAATKSAADSGENVSLMKSLGLADDASTKAAADEARRRRYEKRAEPVVEDMGGGWYVVREDVPPACVTLGSIDAVNDMMTRQRRVERESGVVDLSAKRKLGGMLVALRGQLAAQQEAFKRDTGRAFDRKHDCAELQAALADTQAIETTAEDPQARVRARNIACNAFEWIEIYDGQMKRQRAIERESGVEDLAAKRKIGEVLAGAKIARAKALVDFKRLWKRSFDRATDCATAP